MDLYVTEYHEQASGAIVFYRLLGRVAFDTMEAAAAKHGVPEDRRPTRPSPKVALRRAVITMTDAGQFARRTNHGHWILVRQHESTDDDVTFETHAKAFINSSGRLEIETDDAELRRTITHHYANARRDLLHADFSGWIPQIIGDMDAVSLRPSGGVYYIDKKFRPRISRLRAFLSECSSHVIYEIPALRSDETVEAVMAGLQAEAETIINSAALPKDGKELGTRALGTIRDSLSSVHNKLERYEKLLGGSLDEVKTKVRAVRANIVITASRQSAAKGNS